MLEYYRRKFPDGSEFLVVKSLTYFEDAEEDEIPEMLTDLNWQNVKSQIRDEVRRLYR